MLMLKSIANLNLRNKANTGVIRRYLHLHEYQSMQLLKSHGLPIPQAIMAENVEDAVKYYRQLVGNNKHKDVVLKAQILSGGRGLGNFKISGLKGGVHMCRSEEDVKNYASKMLGDYLVTKQTGKDGVKVNKIFLAERLYLRREMYLSIIMDRKSQGPMFLASASGGTSIETLAKESPELLIYQPIHPINGPTKLQLEEVAKKLNLPKDLYPQCTDILQKLYDIFCKYDATQVEINPFCESSEGKLVICDIKMNFDDNASFRQKELFAMRDTSQDDPKDVEASAANLNYIALSGSIGCLVNGAGLAMATMDAIQLYGGSPANFLDVGGSATEKQVETAFKILNKDPHVKAILVNIFGGIMRCDVIAQGIISAARNLKLEKPIIVRLEGTKVTEANELFKKSGLDLIIARNLCEASEKAVVAAQIGTLAHQQNMKVKIYSDMKN